MNKYNTIICVVLIIAATTIFSVNSYINYLINRNEQLSVMKRITDCGCDVKESI